jgi:hypothetical protein
MVDFSRANTIVDGDAWQCQGVRVLALPVNQKQSDR